MTHWQSYHTLPIGTLRCIIFITCDANANSLVLERVLFCASCRAAKATIASTLGTIQGEFEWIRCTVSERFQHIKQGECLHRRLTASYTWKCGCTDLQQTNVIRHLLGNLQSRIRISMDQPVPLPRQDSEIQGFAPPKFWLQKSSPIAWVPAGDYRSATFWESVHHSWAEGWAGLQMSRTVIVKA